MWTLYRKLSYLHVILLLHIFVVLYFTALLWRWNNTGRTSLEIPVESSRRQHGAIKRKIVLFTTRWWQSHFPYLDEANRFCPRCAFTENQSLWRDSDAIVFHGRMLPDVIPPRQKPNELWVFMLFEALTNYDLKSITDKIVKFDGVFNWTMTYRRDSDIFMPYGKFVNVTKHQRPGYNESWAFIMGANGRQTYENAVYQVTPSIIRNNSKNQSLVAWVVSHCKSKNNRQNIVAELQKYVPIDIYGNCGDNPKKCDVPKAHALAGVDCKIQMQNQYKFYLSFESDNCQDYVTEKFFDIVSATNMIPIVFGGVDYKGMFPEKSFINVRDFKGVKELGEYLKYLDTHPDQWLEYFEWRKHFWVQNNRFVAGYCALCDKLWELEKLKQENRESKTYHHIWDWWLYRRDSNKSSSLACE
ncbi:alpha-(1,3)-fucosyltransferase C [Folsomia candida]|uniref:Fucosyltransferase n=1 Tax=Folsomia candida TaxID=158441 RepID=A0A226ERJ2_FOLCA|nr:alpha-(1,3)-fucosyltransferase C [Folsomia candida]OXA59828.1 Alpha-(1,3)-fucosyltransferase C [Folsomia candida]